jgi:diguanylate cyclase (GGDEF)-like protein
MDGSFRHRQMVRVAAALFGAASVITFLSVLLPHQPQLETAGLVFVAAGGAALTALLLTAGDRLPGWTAHVWTAAGTVLVSFGLLFNGERNGGAAGGDEMYYLWVTLYAAYYLGRLATAFQIGFVAAAYTATLVAIDPGPIGPSRFLTTVGLATGSAVVVRLLSERVERLVAELRLAAATDPLTGLLNRRAFGERCAHELARARRSGETFAALLIDVDHFKQINDRDGHAAGDEALVGLARTLTGELREIDSVARIGGDEFAVLLPGTGVAAARATAERLRERAGVPISIGTAVYGIDGHTTDELARAADAALYDAKRQQRVEPHASGARTAPQAAQELTRSPTGAAPSPRGGGAFR